MYYLTLHEIPHKATQLNKTGRRNQNICARRTQTENHTTGWKMHTVGTLRFAFQSCSSLDIDRNNEMCSNICSLHIDRATDVVLLMCCEYGISTS